MLQFKFLKRILKASTTVVVFLAYILGLSTVDLYAQQSTCINADFEQNSFAGWIGHTGEKPNAGCCPIACPVPGLVPGRHTIMTGTGTDPNTGNLLSVIAPGGLYSVRLGNESTGGEAEQISYSFLVTQQTQMFIYRYAVVLEDFGHADSIQPRFEIRVFDQSGVLDSVCGMYTVSATSGLAGFQDAPDPYDSTSIIRWKDWTTVGIDLSSKLGSTITIEFSTGDCDLGGHFGYAYIDCMCYPFNVSSDFCKGAVNATLTAPPGFSSYLWNTGETTASILINNPVIGDTFTVIMTSVTGCQVALNSIIRQTTVGAAFNVTDSCYNAAFFTDSSYITQGSPINQWLWDFGDGTTSTFQNPTHAYGAQGNYNVTLIITTQGGCKDTVSHNISTIDVPEAGFSFLSVCPGSATSFTDTSSGTSSLVTWLWDFGDGSVTSSSQNNTHTFGLPGNYTVTLVVEDSNSCRDTALNIYTTIPAPVAAFTDSITCANNMVFFKDVSVVTGGSVASQSWDFGDNTTVVSGSTPNHSYAATGTYIVTLTVTSNTGCVDTFQRPITLFIPPVANFTSVTACAGQPVSFTDVTPPIPVAWQWNFGDGSPFDYNQNPVHVYANDSNISVILIITDINGCVDTVQKTIFIPSLPLPSFAVVNPVCTGSPVQFANTTYSPGGAQPSQWNFGDGSSLNTVFNPAHTFIASGNYPVTLIATTMAGCIDSITQNIFINPLPVSIFTAANVCKLQPASFQDHSTTSVGTITGWHWTFGDASAIDTTPNPSHAYQTANTFNVTLTVTASTGCSASAVNPVTVYALPVAGMTVSPVCTNDPHVFVDVSDSGSAALTNWFWNFGDGGTIVNVQNPVHAYADSGLYLVQLVVVNANYCYDTTQHSLYIKPLPEAGFSNTVLCKDSAVLFNDLSTLAGGNITIWWWDFGDGSSSLQQHPSHTYLDAGPMNVQLVVAGNNSCRDTLNKPLLVNPLPVPAFSFTNICQYDTLQIHDHSSLINGFITHWQWNFGDGNSDTVQNPAHHYNNDGSFNIHLTVTGNTGCSYDTMLTTIIYPQPQSVFTAGNACEDNVVFLTGNSSIATGNLVHWVWDMGDGSPQVTLQNVQHVFYNDTTYMITLMVFSDLGCIDTSQQLITVHPMPDPEFSADTVCFALATSFTNHSTVALGLIQQYHWSFGYSAFSNAVNPQFIFNNYGLFPVQLTAVTDFGCIDSVMQNVKVYQLPEPDFSADVREGCQPLPVSFTDLSVSQEGFINQWQWNFGDGNTASDSMPGNLFLNDGVFDVSLTVTTNLNCTDSITKSNYITVHPKPQAGFIYTPVHPNQLFPLVQFTDQSTGADYWLYFFGDNDSSTDVSPVHAYLSSGEFNVMQVVTTDFGCIDTAFRIIEVENVFTLYIPNAFTPNSDGKNDDFKAFGLGITGFNMTIFNRWGQPIFTSLAMDETWNGTHNGNAVPQDVYYYHVKVTDLFDKEHILNGSVSVIY